MRMFTGHRKGSFVVASTCMGVVAAQASAAVVSWDGGSAGTGSVWASPLNWSTDTLPQDGDSIVVASTSVAGVYVSGANSSTREMYLNQSAGGTGGGTPFTGNPPSKSFQSITFGTEDAATTLLPTGMTVLNGINANYRVDNLVRLTGDANGRVLAMGAGATANAVSLSNGSFGLTTYELAGNTPATNTIHVAAAGSRITLNTARVSGTGGLTKTGAGIVYINSATNTISGDFYANEGLLGFGTAGAMGPSTNTTFVADAATLSFDSLANVGETVGANHAISLSGANSRIAVGTGESWFVTGAISGNGALNKTGSGSLNLNGALTYTGGTNVLGGGLYINSSLNGGLTNGTGTTIGGLGTINGNVTVGGNLLPGSSTSIGTLTVNGNLTLSNGVTAGTFTAGLSATDANADVANVLGTFDLAGGTLAITNLAARSEAAIVIANYATLVGDFGNVTGLLGGWTLDKNYNNTNKIALIRGNTQLYFTGASSSAFNTAANFTIDPTLTTSTTQYATASTDVYIDNGRPLGNNNQTVGAGNTYVNSLTFNDTGVTGPTPFTLSQANSGTGTLVIKASGINYAAGTGILVTGGSVTNVIATPVTVANAQSWTNNGAGTLSVTGNVNLGTNTLTLGGSGTVSLGGVVGGSGALTVTGAGTVQLTGANTYTGVTTVNKSAGALVLNTAAQTAVLGGAGGADVRNGSLVLENGDANVVRSLLAGSFTAATTPGIMDSGQLRSSTATLTRGLGYKVDGSNVIVKAALFGDADLDGGVSINDFNALAGNFGQSSGKVWVDGDFDYDGGVSINDFNLLAGGFGQSLPPTSELWAGLLAFAAAHNDLAAFEAVTGVPEPTSLALIAAGTTLVLRRRRSA